MSEKRKVKPVPLFLDNPVDTDTLGVEQLAHTIAGAAIGNPGPFTIGVFGGWGKGKTSILKIARALLQSKETWEHPVATVWFNAWQHEREDHPLFSLIAAIVDGLEKESEQLSEEGDKLSRRAKLGFKNAALSLRALTRGMKFSGKVGVPLVGEIGAEFDASKALAAEELLGKQNHPLVGELLYHKAFEGLGLVTEKFRDELSDIESGIHANVVVFIDDLDRCNPERALHLLEGIKLILSQPGFIFVIGIDRNVIEKYLEYIYDQKYKIADENRGQKYLDKMVQLALNVPNYGQPFEDHLLSIIQNLGNRTKNDQNMNSYLKVIQEHKDVIIAGSGGNPRTLVRLLNGFMVDCQHWGDNNQFKIGDVAGALIFHRLLEAKIGESSLDQSLADDVLWHKMLNGQIGEILNNESQSFMSIIGVAEKVERELATVLLQNPDLLNLLSGKAAIYALDQNLRRCIRQMTSQTDKNQEVVVVPLNLIRPIKRSLRVRKKSDITNHLLGRAIYFDFDEISVTENDVKFIVENMPNLEYLDLDDVSISGELLATLCKGLNKVKSLSMPGWNVTNEIASIIASYGTQLDYLMLSGSRFEEGALKNIVESAKNIKEIHLSSIPSLDDKDLLNIIENLKKLECISLTNSGITDIGGLMFAKGLPRLARLILAVDNISDSCMPALLEGLPKLTQISLSSSQITDKSVGMLAEKAINLNMLSLAGTGVTDYTLDLVARNFPELETLWIGSCNLTTEAVKHFKDLRPDVKVH